MSGPDWRPGLTDRPNNGGDDVGYVPARNITLRWATYTEAANQAGQSRLYGGIHPSSDNVDGLTFGRSVGTNVYNLATALFAGTRPSGGQCSSAPAAASVQVITLLLVAALTLAATAAVISW